MTAEHSEPTAGPADLEAAPVRIDRRTKDLVKRCRPGDVAVIAHDDLDRVAAEGLVAARVRAVVNCGTSITGRYPNGGPIRLLEAGIPLLDEVDPAIFSRLREGDAVAVAGDAVLVGGEVVARGTLLDADGVRAAMAAARDAIGDELRRFSENTLEYVGKEADDFFAPIELPTLHTAIRGRHALVVVRGHDYQRDLAALRPYIREYRPVLIGVDGGADALVDAGFPPDIIIGDFDSVGPAAVGKARDIVLHVHRDGRGPGRDVLDAWGVDHVEFAINGMSEDAAMLLAYEAGATLIVAVGTHATMVEMLDKGRRGMASTFLTRLRLGPVLVDAKGVNQLYEGRVRRRDVLLLVLAAFFVILVVTLVSEPLQVFLDGIRLTVRDLWFTITDWF